MSKNNKKRIEEEGNDEQDALQNCLTKELYESLVSKATEPSFNDCIGPDVIDRASGLGLLAADKTAYEDYRLLFDKYIE